MALAAALGPRMATAIISGYLVAGAIGLPVFSGTPAKGIGIAYMFGPTGGYLLGMLLAAPLVGYLSVSRGIPGKIVAMLLGLTAIYLPGLAWLAAFVPVEKILAFGFYPFIAADLIKVILAACGVHAILSLLNRFKSQGL
ncbi:MAG: biotin transporter BioY [Cycloclasticus sp.]|nr:biotin transporter BioY [Cycloclasticus sp.]